MYRLTNLFFFITFCFDVIISNCNFTFSQKKIDIFEIFKTNIIVCCEKKSFKKIKNSCLQNKCLYLIKTIFHYYISYIMRFYILFKYIIVALLL